jgi:hypothetical protein
MHSLKLSAFSLVKYIIVIVFDFLKQANRLQCEHSFGSDKFNLGKTSIMLVLANGPVQKKMDRVDRLTGVKHCFNRKQELNKQLGSQSSYEINTLLIKAYPQFQQK